MRTVHFFIFGLLFLYAEALYSQTTVPARSLGPTVNSKAIDLAPYLMRDGLTLFFTSNRGDSKKDHLYVTKRKSFDSAWGEPGFVKIPNNQYVIGAITFDGQGGMYCASAKPGGIQTDMNLWFEGLTDTVMKELPSPVNTTHWESAPTVTSDGKDLYFTSNRDDTHDGSFRVDIFVTHPNPDGSWTKPENLGRTINKGTYNATPFITPDGKFLFFASTPANSPSAKAEIYMAERTGKSYTDWTTPVALPAEINSEFDEVSPMVASDGKTLYFASNRKGDSNFDIYEATLPEDIQRKLAGSFPGFLTGK
jgi:Tol biopolymer transport system component